MTKPAAREPLRRNSRSNRARILATARRSLGRNPDITLEELARLRRRPAHPLRALPGPRRPP